MWDFLAVLGVLTLAAILFGVGFVMGIVVANTVNDRPEDRY